MNAAYFDNNKDEMATFDLFIRKLPNEWGFFIANGIEDAIDYATNIKFRKEDIEYLKQQKKFKPEFLESLKDFKFKGEIHAVKEGTPVFPNQPVMRITAKRTQAQFIETTLLNTINFQTMIATKANRIVNAAGKAAVIDFGLRRASGPDAGMLGARAAYIGGAVGTSNVKAGMEYKIPISGTHAHSFVMSFPTELESFRAYVKTFPDNSTLLIDTYDTAQGARNAAIVAKELEKKGHKLGAVRLDSGDLAILSKRVRFILDSEGLDYVKIVASNDLNEYKIDNLKQKGAKIDGYGVGTEMITAKPVSAISGVYKIVEDEEGPKIKLSPGKKTYPGKKQIYRFTSDEGFYMYDMLTLEDEFEDGIPLLEQVVKDGKRVSPRRDLEEIRSYALNCVSKLPTHVKQLRASGHSYMVGESFGLRNLVDKLSEQYEVKEQVVRKPYIETDSTYASQQT